MQFLNGIKAIFDVPGCLYLVSVSEDAMAIFASQTPAIKTAFDSAFDEITRVDPMTFEEARELLDLRVTGVPLPFLALCHVLAGGVPRGAHPRIPVAVPGSEGGQRRDDARQ